MKLSYLFYEPIQRLEDCALRMRTLKELGYSGVELTAMHPWSVDPAELLTLSRELQLPIVSLLTGWSYGNEGLCLCSPDPRIRAAASDRLIQYVGLASQLKSLVVIGLMQGLRKDEPSSELAVPRIAAALTQVARAAESSGVTIAIEPVNHLQVGFHHTAAEVVELIDRIGSPSVALMLDSIHMNIEERSPIETIRRYSNRLVHFHLCESNGGAFGTGNINFGSLVRTLEEVGYSGYLSLKIYRHASWSEAAQDSMAFLRQLAIPTNSSNGR